MTATEVVSEQGLYAATTADARAIAHVAVFCATAKDLSRKYIEPSRELIGLIGDAGLGIVYCAADVGLIHHVGEQARESNAHIIGVGIETTRYDRGPTDDFYTTPHEGARAAKMLELADGVAVLPGGIGTAREALTTTEAFLNGQFDGPVAYLNAAGYYSKLWEFFEHMETEGFLQRTLAEAGVLLAPTPAAAYTHITQNMNAQVAAVI